MGKSIIEVLEEALGMSGITISRSMKLSFNKYFETNEVSNYEEYRKLFQFCIDSANSTDLSTKEGVISYKSCYLTAEFLNKYFSLIPHHYLDTAISLEENFNMEIIGSLSIED